VTETVGPRTAVWEDIQDWIRQSRAIANRADSITETQAHIVEDEDGEFVEIWVPAAMINRICDEWGLAPNALQSELSERGVDSDDVSGGGLSEAFSHEGKATRFWRFDLTHDEVPLPQEVVEEIDDGLDRDYPGQGFSYGGDGE
jgi:hypothetical protein